MVKINNNCEPKISKTLNSPAVSFKGYKITQDNSGKKYYEFFLPTNASDVQLQTMQLKYDNLCKRYEPIRSSWQNYPMEGNGFLKKFEIPCDKFENSTENTRLGYRFKVDGKYFLDNAPTINNRLDDRWNYNVTFNPDVPMLQLPHQLYHLMPDNFNPPVKPEKDGSDVRRTHFNKFDGNINSITEKLDYLKKLGVRRVLSTPIFGDDRLSSNGYWTSNPYQITRTLGTIDDFKKLNVELYKRGMGLMADGAFVNEGWESIHMADFLKYGEKSYGQNFYNVFGLPVQIGILPENKYSEAYKNFRVKIINGPYRVSGSSLERNPDFDNRKPTYIQTYDDRFVDEDYRTNTEVLRSYPIKNLPDKNKVRTYKDSVPLLCLEVRDIEVENKFKEWKSRKSTPVQEILCSWENFVIAGSRDKKNLELWNQKVDLPKIKYFTESTNSMSDDEYKKQLKASYQVQDYFSQVGRFWTDQIDKTLVEYTAKAISANPTGKSNINDLARQGILPDALIKLTNNNEVNDTNLKNVQNGSYQSNKDYLPKNLLDCIMSYPLDAIEFPRALCSILSSPYVKKLAVSEDTIGMSRYDFMKSKEYDKQTDKVYKETDKIYKEKMLPLVTEIIKNSRSGSKLLNSGGELTEEGKELFRLVSDDIVKYLVIKAIANYQPKIATENNIQKFEWNLKELEDKAFENIYLNVNAANNSKTAADYFVYSLNGGLSDKKRITPEDKKILSDYIDSRLTGLDAGTVRVARFLVNKSESGLDWRIDAAEYIGKESIPGAGAFEERWEVLTKFWDRFNTLLRKFNPNAYTIAEVSTTTKYATDKGYSLDLSFKGKKNITILPRKAQLNDISFGSSAKGMTMAEYDSYIIDKGKFNGITEYTHMFAHPSRLVHGAAEDQNCGHYGDMDDALKKMLIKGWDSNDRGYLFNGNSSYTHVSTGNPDKPRLLHGYSLNIAKFFNRDDKLAEDKQGPAVAMRDAFLDSLDIIETAKSDKNSQKYKDKISGKGYEQSELERFVKVPLDSAKIQRLKDAVHNISEDKEYKDFFGIRPFNHNWEDIMARSGLNISKNSPDYASIENAVQLAFLKPAMNKYVSMLKIITCLPGSATIYGGDELGETGYDTVSNDYLQNRNRLHWEWLDNGNSSFKEFLNNYNNEIKKIYNLRNKPYLSPLVNGYTILLKMPLKSNPADDKGTDLAAIYRYNDETDVVAVLNRGGFNNTREAFNFYPQDIDYIDLSYVPDSKCPRGIPGGLKEGTVYKNANINDWEDKNAEYKVVKENGKLVIKKVENGKTEGTKIHIAGPVLLLYRAKKFDGNENI